MLGLPRDADCGSCEVKQLRATQHEYEKYCATQLLLLFLSIDLVFQGGELSLNVLDITSTDMD